MSKVFLHGLPYYNLKIHFKEGKITEYTCTNFDSEEENKKSVDNILHNHQTLPIGEFAIGTNTTAYAVQPRRNMALQTDHADPDRREDRAAFCSRGYLLHLGRRM